ncbi:MAG: TIR domain-containing protein, partial [Parvibaculum sp.]
MAELYRYAAFISYSSKDAPFARRLHRALESYGIPSSLGKFDLIGGGGRKNRIYPVFRDREELSAGQLGEQIEANLKASGALVVICSPDGAASPWVQKEIEFFAAQGRHDKIFAIIPDTAPLTDANGVDATQSCFPPAFRGDALAGDKLEPLAADARKGKDGFRNAWLKIVAGMIGVSPGQIIDRDKKRRAQQRLAVATLVAVVAVAGVAALGQIAASIRSANESRASIYAEEAQARIAEGRHDTGAMLIALAGDPAARNNWLAHLLSPEGYQSARTVLVAAYLENRLIRRFDAETSVMAVTFSRDGARAATTGNSYTSVWNVASGLEIRRFENGRTGAGISVALSPDGGRVAFGSNGGVVKVWDVGAGQMLFEAHGGSSRDAVVAFSPDGSQLAIGGRDGTRVLDATTGAELQHFDGSTSSVAFSPNGLQILAGGSDGAARLWDIAARREVRRFEHGTEVSRVAYSSTGAIVMTASKNGAVRVWDVASGAETIHFEAPRQRLSSAALSPDGARVVVGSEGDHAAHVFDVRTGRELGRLEGHEHLVSSAAFSPDGARILTGSYEGTALLWDATEGREARRYDDAGTHFVAAFSVDGSRILAGTTEGVAVLRDSATGRIVQRFEGHPGPVTAVAITRDGARVLTGSVDGIVRLWDVNSGRVLRLLDDDAEGVVTSVGFAADGSRVIVAVQDGRARLWDIENGTVLRRFDTAPDLVNAAISPDGSRILTGGYLGEVGPRLWDAETGRQIFLFNREVVGSVFAGVVAFSPDGSRVAIGWGDGVTQVWDATTGRELHRYSGAGWPLSIAFSPDGKLLVTGGDVITVADAQSGRLLRSFSSSRGVWSVGFSPTEPIFFSAGDDGLHVWEVDPIIRASADEQVRLACESLARLGITQFPDADLARFPELRTRA